MDHTSAEGSSESASSPERLSQFSQILDRFERSWRDGNAPSLEEYLRDAGSSQEELVQELLAIEVYWRQRNGQPMKIRELKQRFPDQDTQVVKELVQTRYGKRQPSETVTNNAGQTKHHRRKSLDVGVKVGPYTLTRRLGSGGFGVVFAAEQLQPIKRNVAIKIIKPGMDSGEIVARFEAERQALAVIDHPNVARVIDAGQTETGQPFFVMELVDGSPLTDFCVNQKLSLQQRLELFLDICSAVQHAHQKGIIHRDLKPSNVLVGEKSGKATPKVIDFGIAKAIFQPLTDAGLATREGQLMGTPMYMSPEQAAGSIDVDGRSDVYALGAVLYELLTEEPPFEKKQFNGKSLEQIIRVIRESEPRRPSVRLAESTKTSVGDQGSISSLISLYRGELDWIVMKAMAKERDRRYDSPAVLAGDIKNYLFGRAVVARPPSKVYLAKKFFNRHKVPVIAAALVLLSLFAGIVGTSYSMLTAEQRRKEASQARSVVADLAVKLENQETAIRNLTPIDPFSQIASTPVSGTLLGEEFRPDHFELDGDGQLRLKVGDDFAFPDGELSINLSATYEEITSKQWNLAADNDQIKFPPASVAVGRDGKRKSKYLFDGYDLKLIFAQKDREHLQGKIVFAIPGEPSTHVSGTFTVELEIDPKAPPSEFDKPYVLGDILLPSDVEGEVVVGYTGESIRSGKQGNWYLGRVIPGGGGGAGTNISYQPRITRVITHGTNHAEYNHVRLEPGTYLFYAQWTMSKVAWKWLVIDDQTKEKLDASFANWVGGRLHVEVGLPEVEVVRLLPLNEDGSLPSNIDAGEARMFAAELPLQKELIDGAVDFDELQAGIYRVYCGLLSKDVVIQPGRDESVSFN